MKYLFKKLLLKMFSRKEIFYMAFNEYERTAIVNALWRRTTDDRDKERYKESKSLTQSEERIKYACTQLAMEL